MAKVTFGGVAVAVGVQTAFGTPDGTIAALTTPLVLTDGVVLGDKESGDAESGVTIPNIVGQYRDVAVVAASLTESADAFEKVNVEGFAISWVHQGNGAAPLAAPGTGDLSVIIPGLEAILESSGLIGAAGGGNEEQDYTVRHDASAGGTTIYSTWKIFHGTLAYVFSDCLVESLVWTFTSGGLVIVTANVAVGTFDDTTAVTGFTFPDVNYGIMASQTGPKVEGVAFTAFGHVRGFETLTVTISNETETFGDSNIAVTGEVLDLTRRIISLEGTIYVDDADDDAAFQELRSGVAPTFDASFQVGTAGAAALNAFKLEINNLQPKDIKYNRLGTKLVVEINDAKATATAVGAEFQLTQN